QRWEGGRFQARLGPLELRQGKNQDAWISRRLAMGQADTALMSSAMEVAHRLRAEDIAGRLDIGDVLKSRVIIDLVHLPKVPPSGMFVKGVVEGPGKVIPLMDMRVNLNVTDRRVTEDACALIVDVGGVEVGLIVPTAASA
ncbi:MAG: chemotaxis protein CheW, partial [Planctomycetes bacterium]|nr:chemotaxis protein CheW [Planctomycetota bacterium]